MPDKLPKGWVKTTLGEIARPARERVLPMEVPTMPYVGLEHIEPQTMRLLGQGQAGEVRSSSMRFLEGDVLYGKMRPYLNKVWVANFDGLCSAEFLVFSKRDGLNSQFLAMRLNTEDFVTFANGQVSGERPRVDFEKLSRFPILLPPLAEQERIVAKLNTALSGVERAATAVRRARERTERYRAAVLDAAVTGKLTRTWRESQHRSNTANTETGDSLLQRLLAARRVRWEQAELLRLRTAGKEPKNATWKSPYPEPVPPVTRHLAALPNGWVWASIDQLSIVVRGASPRPAGDPRYFGGPIPWITVGSLTRDSKPYLSETAETLTEAGKEASRYIEVETLLLTNSGATLGVPKISRIAGCINDGVAALLFIDYPLKLYLYYFLTVETERLRSINQGAAQPNLNTGIIRAIVVPLPPLAEQTEIIRVVEQRLTAADRLTAKLEQQSRRANDMRQSILREAFAGRLAPQDSRDESASLLLERIRANRQAKGQESKLTTEPKHMSKSKSKLKSERRPLATVLREHKTPLTPEQLFRESGYEAAFNDSESPQDLVDLFYKELRKLTNSPAKVVEERKSKHQVLLRALQ